ncbi:InlB B-repeat-containing protein [Butyrivibrio sp.]|uniref:InlB B-repeat-containing protein n=1 Tax=Butyrivibrio sp. TaxID=28121 RepID=UPI0025C0FBA8|nr:InlB B-repeat-containing protein [Butyrivibrio sp.]
MNLSSFTSNSTSYTLNANVFKKKGYKFIEWNTKADGSGKTYADKAKIVPKVSFASCYCLIYPISLL